MICKNCGKEVDDIYSFCDKCGAPTKTPTATEQQQPQSNPVPPVVQQPVYQQAPPVYQQQPVYTYQTVGAVNNQQDLSPTTTIGQYILWLIISCLPIIGWILVIVFAVDTSNKNRANFFRSIIVLYLILGGVFLLFGSVIVGALSDLLWSL